ncbi:MAG TPA: glycine cleavage system aminomethyltransferase GcvT [Feifaniaceae bacterium]|nr:glycine cleavage system aminomethyltransferase GcvT [Feifaniaceae bacterium]
MEGLHQTPLYRTHVALGGKLIDFGGWALPVQYSSVLEEHRAVRERAGLFDVSHMGEIFVLGRGAERYLDHLLTNGIASMQASRCRYSPMCYPDGGTVDDVIVYKFTSERYLVVVNASNTQKDFEWMQKNAEGFDVTIGNQSAQWAQIALQGPKANEILAPLCDGPLPEKNYSFSELKVNGVPAVVSRTGYTGENGLEIYCAAEYGEGLFNTLLETGTPFGILPCGLGARDTLRFEAGMPLYGHELSKDITPREAGLGFAIKLDKGEFIGREGLLEAPARVRIGLKLTDRGIARGGEDVLVNGKKVGVTTSGAPSPTLNASFAMALVDARAANETAFSIVVRNRPLQAEQAPLPFYKRGK